MPYKPGYKRYQESWETVARDFGIDVDWLIYFNFMTKKSDVVNWYLRHYVGCKKVSPSGNNWMFSNDARPGIIYIPPPDDELFPDEPKDKHYEYDPEGDMCSWSPNGIEEFKKQLKVIAHGIPGENGRRIKRLVQVIGRRRVQVDDLYYRSPKAVEKYLEQYWYYHPRNIEKYIDWKTQPSDRWKATQESRGAFPFRGQSPWWGQQQSEAGGEEYSTGMWQIHAVKKMFADFCRKVDPAAVKKRLLAIDDEMYKGWYQMTLIDFKTHHGGGSVHPIEIESFVSHVRSLTKDKNHLYWAFGK